MKKLGPMAFSVLVGILVFLAFGKLTWLKSLELKAFDLLASTMADPASADNDIVLVAVDQESLDFYEKDDIPWPWPRTMYNPVIEYCKKAGAKVIAFDILFNNASPYGESTDAEFADAIKSAGNVYLAASFVQAGTGREADNDILTRSKLNVTFQANALPPDKFKYAMASGFISQPLPIIADAAAGIGNVVFFPDQDGIFRQAPLVVSYKNEFYPSILMQIVMRAAGVNSVEFGYDSVTVGNIKIPVEWPGGRVLVKYPGPAGTYKRYSAMDIINSYLVSAEGETPSVPPDALKDKIVLIGYTAPGLYDLRPTPTSAVYPGVEVYASAVDNIFNGVFLRPANPWLALISVLVLCIMLTSATFFHPNQVFSTGVFFALTAGIAFLSFISYKYNIWLPYFGIVSGGTASFLSSAVLSYATEGKRKREIVRAFGYYLSPAVVSEIVANPDSLRLGGEKRNVTILFSDIAGFTSISEKLDPADLVAFLNEYLTILTGVILEHRGTVDKYIGDAVMAFWNAPLEQPDHAMLACSAAVEIQNRLKPISEKYEAKGYPVFETRIGLNTGEAVIGNMGSTQRFDYTAIGDNVNLASRLEGSNKMYGTRIIVSESTKAAAGEGIICRELDLIKVKGKNRPVGIFELISLSTPPQDESLGNRIALFSRALEQYKQCNWNEARQLFRKMIELSGRDSPAQVYIERCDYYEEHPPPPDWDGSFTMKTK